MERLLPRIKEIAENIQRTENKRKKLAGFLKEVGRDADIHQQLKKDLLEKISICGVDGGLAKKSLHGFDCILARAAATCFHYSKGKVEKVTYHPGRIPSPHADILEALSDLDWAHFSSIMRVTVETATAIEAIRKLKPDVILMDGSIVPHYSDRPSKSSDVYRNYSIMLQTTKALFQECTDKGIVLAGVIEDSRGTSFCSLIERDVISKVSHPRAEEMKGLLAKTRDTNLLYWALEQGYRSRVFPYSEKPRDHPILRDMDNFGKRIFSYYLKTAKHDRPIRVDMLASGDDPVKEADSLGERLLSISGQHSGYGLPAPLIEADNVAKLSESEVENFYSYILSFAGNTPSAMKLRREQRPF